MPMAQVALASGAINPPLLVVWLHHVGYRNHVPVVTAFNGCIIPNRSPPIPIVAAVGNASKHRVSADSVQSVGARR